jgi:arabinofuranan 3-O-arabinosyltransferase
MATPTSPGHRRAGAFRWLELAVFAVLAYAPPLLSSPGRVSADTKQYLYLDPGAFLARAPYLWDAQAGAGGVSHQHIGYLWPMGPWYWAFDAAGVPTWVAQRLWLGTLSLTAALGARWLLRRLGLDRLGALAGALVYLLTPFQLAFTARTSVLLLGWAALPWMIGLVDRGHREGGWRDPAILALLATTVGSVNASTLVLIAVGPLVWLLCGVTSRAAAARAGAVIARVGVLSAAVSLWWITGLRLEAAYGLPVLQVTENLESVAATSSPSDVLRGLGNWYFYGKDRLGFSIDQAQAYLDDRTTVAATFTLVALALAAAVAVRWRHRARFVALVLAGTVVAVGAWPLEDPSPFARAVADFTDTSAGLALRNTARAAPVVVLGLAGLLGAAISALAPMRRRIGALALVAVVALAGLEPVARTGVLSEHQQRVDPVPSHWSAAADELDAAGTDTRVLELPGSNFAAYRWGNLVDPLLPGLMERGYVSREVLPLGSESSVLLVDALDRRLQEGTLEPAAIAPVARLLGAGDVVVRHDLEYERFRTPNPRELWDLLRGTDVPGLGEPVTFGPRERNQASPTVPMLDEIELRQRAVKEEPPPVAVYPVEDPVPIVRVAPVSGPVLLAGDGDGIVDAAAAGLVDGHAMLLQATSLPAVALEGAIDAGADLIVTDTYRRRIQTWFYAIRDTRGPTERAGETLHEPTGYDVRIDPTPEVGDPRRTVTEHRGGTITATSSGGAARPEDRATAAMDGDRTTSWRVGGADPRGERWRLRLDRPVEASSITLHQPTDGPRDRRVTEVRIRVDDRRPIDVALTDASFTADGQVVELGPGGFRELELELLDVSSPPFDPALANAVGFAEVTVPGVAVEEWVRVPTDLLARAGPGHRTDLVLTRLRYDPSERGRHDQEPVLRRLVDLPEGRSFTVTGTARIDERGVPNRTLDLVLGTSLGGGRVSATSRLQGDPLSRGSRAVDGDPATWWQSAFGRQESQELQLWPATPGTVRDLVVHVVQDAHHSVPGELTLLADGVEVGSVAVPDGPGEIVAVPLPDPPNGAVQLTIRMDQVLNRTPIPGSQVEADILPVAIAEVEGTGLPRAVDGDAVNRACRPLLRVDGRDVLVRIAGSPADARRGLALEACAPLELGAGEHAIESNPRSGITVDRLVLSSNADGSAGELGPRGARRDEAPAQLEVEDDDRGARYRLQVDADGAPFWLVVGQSDSPGWDVDVDGGATVSKRRIVDGYANGWIVDPSRPGELAVTASWQPQRLVWIALALSGVAVVVCLVVALRGARHRGAAPADAPALADPPGGRRPLTPEAPALAVLVGVLTLLVATPSAALTASAAVVVGLVVPRATWAWLVAAPAFVLLSRYLDAPRLAWIALALLAADLAVERWTVLVTDRRAARRARARAGAPAR